MSAAEERVSAGDPQAALEHLQREVRERPAEAKLRVFLFQLLCITGQWQRALAQLQVCGELDAATLPMVNTYREAVQCERVREAVFAGQTTPMVFGEPQVWVAWLVQALQDEARGDAASAARWRAQALDAAQASPGTLNGEAFDWIADADSRLGPLLEAVINARYCWVPFAALSRVVIEAPVDLRDLVWVPARFELSNGGETVALLPSRYVGSAQHADGSLQLARRTEWAPLAAQQYRGLGQRVLATSGAEVALFEAREIVFQPSLPPPLTAPLTAPH